MSCRLSSNHELFCSYFKNRTVLRAISQNIDPIQQKLTTKREQKRKELEMEEQMVRQITKRAMAATSARDTFVKGTLNFE